MYAITCCVVLKEDPYHRWTSVVVVPSTGDASSFDVTLS